MSLQLVTKTDYSGLEGIAHIRSMQQALNQALNAEDWSRVRSLDKACAVVINKVIAANKDDGSALVMALSDLKGVYSSLIQRCQHEVASMAH